MDTIRTLRNLVNVQNHGTQYRNSGELPSMILKYRDFAKQAYEDEPKKHLRGYNYDPQISTDQFAVYHRQNTNQTVLAIRGSAVASDFLISDMQIMAGKSRHRQYYEALNKYREIRSKYGDSELRTTGHSLGGATSALLGSELGIPSYVFNPGSSPLGDNETLRGAFDSDHVLTVSAEGDLVSAAAIHHARNLHVVKNWNKNPLNTVDRHLMDVFYENPEISKIRESLKQNGVKQVDDIIHNLSLKGHSDETLKAKHTQLASNLKAGGIHQAAINEGAWLGGGFHTKYSPKASSLIDLDGEKVPAPGAKIYVSPVGMYIFDRNMKPSFLTGSLVERSNQLKRARGYGSGPTLFVSPNGYQQAMVPSHGGRGLDMVPANSLEEYQVVLGGHNRLGKGDGFWSGEKSSLGFVGNGFVEVFTAGENIPQTADDKWADYGDQVGEFLVQNTLFAVGMGAELIADALSAGTAEIVIQSINGLMSATGATDLLQGEINKLLPERHNDMSSLDLTNEIQFNPDNIPSQLGRDDNASFQLASLKEKYHRTLNKTNGMGLPRFQYQKLVSMEPPDANTPGYRERMRTLTSQLNDAEKSVDSVQKLTTLNKKAKRVGLGYTTRDALSRSKTRIFSDHPDVFENLVAETEKSVNKKVKQGLSDAPTNFSAEYESQLGIRGGLEQIALEKTRPQFNSVFQGPENEREAEFSKYKQDYVSALQNQDFNIDKVGADRKLFLAKGQPSHTTYVKSEYFKTHQAERQTIESELTSARLAHRNNTVQKLNRLFKNGQISQNKILESQKNHT